jgi:transcriptional regulator with XRE-family HTH domain
MKRKTLSQAELAHELSVSRPLISKWLRDGLLIPLPDGRLDRMETLQRLRLHWCPSQNWWRKPVPRRGLGAQLRALLEYDVEVFLAECGITENDLRLPEITRDELG